MGHKMILNDEELKKYEKILLNENMLFELNAIPQMVVNKDRVIIRVNKKFTKLFAYKKDEILGKQTLMLTPSKEKFEEYKKYFTQTKDGVIKSEELEYKKNDDTLFWVKLEGNPINQEKDNLFILWSFIDITTEVNYRNQLSKLNEELKELVNKDHMTNLYNRRYFSDMAEQNFKLTKRYNHNLSVIMLDIDKFKNVNDTYGHSTGDDVIIKVSKKLLELARDSDIVSRYGGEEFVILFPQTTLAEAVNIAERIRYEIEKISIQLEDGNKLSVTVSIGASEVLNNLDKSIESSIQRADKALYEAKESGRNKVLIN